MDSIKDLLKKKDAVDDFTQRRKYVTKEFQDYGYRIALKLGEEDRASLYIKLAKEKPRALLDQAFSFAIDYPNAKNRGRLFMWKLKELEEEQKERKKEKLEEQQTLGLEEPEDEKPETEKGKKKDDEKGEKDDEND